VPKRTRDGALFNTSTKAYTFLDDPSAALSGVSITQITGVNNAGEITGFYVDPTTGLQRGFLATPGAAATPEPGTYGLLLGALLPVLAAGRSFRSRLKPRAN
jgi:hypothetical protein